MQEEAGRLKNLTSDNSRTKVVALGIGSQIGLNELNRTVSEPSDRNRFHAVNFSSLSDVEDQLRNAICSGRYWSLIIVNNLIVVDYVFRAQDNYKKFLFQTSMITTFDRCATFPLILQFSLLNV